MSLCFFSGAIQSFQARIPHFPVWGGICIVASSRGGAGGGGILKL